MQNGYGIRKVYLTSRASTGQSPTVRELADEMAKQVSGFFGSADPITEEQLSRLSSHITREAISWVNDEFQIGLK